MASPADLANLYAWYDSSVGLYDATSGGSPVTADGATIARWEDQSGNARHVTQATSGNRPILDAVRGWVVSPSPDNRWFIMPASFTLDRQAFSFFVVMGVEALRRPFFGSLQQYRYLAGAASGNFLQMHWEGLGSSSSAFKSAVYDGAFRVTTTIPLTTELCLVGFVGKSTGLHGWLDAVNTSTTALTAGSSTLAGMVGVSGAPLHGGIRDLIVYSRALSDSEITDTLVPYAISRGMAASRANQIVFEGDSITQGAAVTVNRNWPSLLSYASAPLTVRRRCTAEASITLATLATQAAGRIDPLIIGGETNILVAFASTNDIAFGMAQATAYTNYVTYCQARQAAGWKVIACTCVGRSGTIYSTFNSSVRTNWATFADALCDFGADTRLADSTDLTYFNADQIHPNDAGHVVMASLGNVPIGALLPASDSSRLMLLGC